MQYKTNTLLFEAVDANNIEKVRQLIKDGVDVNERVSSELMTALHWAVYKGYVDIVQLLLDTGADLKAETVVQLTPLDYAENYTKTHKNDILQMIRTYMGIKTEQSDPGKQETMTTNQSFFEFLKQEIKELYGVCVDTVKEGSWHDIGVLIGLVGAACFVIFWCVGLLMLLGLGIVIAMAFVMQLLGITFGQLIGIIFLIGISLGLLALMIGTWFYISD